MIEKENMPCCQPDLNIEIVNNNITVFHPATKKSYVIGEAEYTVLIHLGGINSYEKLAVLSAKYNTEQIKALIKQFEKMGFISGKKVIESAEKGLIKRRKLGIINGNRLIKTDNLLTKIFYFILVYLSVPLFLIGIFFYYKSTNRFSSVNLREVVEMTPFLHFASFIIVATLHELSHAIIARRNQIPVPEIGIMLYLFVPYVYTNMSYIRLLKSKWKRILCLLGGILLHILLSGICFLIAGFVPVTNRLIFEEIAYMNLFLVISNLMVFFKLDGYFILQEMIGETYLREKSIDIIREILSNAITKIITRKENSKVRFERKVISSNIFYIVFGILSIGYIPVVLASFLTNLYGYFFR